MLPCSIGTGSDRSETSAQTLVAAALRGHACRPASPKLYTSQDLCHSLITCFRSCSSEVQRCLQTIKDLEDSKAKGGSQH